MHFTSDIEFSKALRADPSDSPVYWSWVWNGRLSREGIKREIDEFSKAGIGALYIIPEPKEFRPSSLRTCLEPPYMSDEYLELYRYAMEYALSRGMKLWLYDEGGWPSGGACGLTKKAYNDCDPMILCRRELEIRGDYRPSPFALAAFKSDGSRLKSGESYDGKLTEFTAERRYAGVNLVDCSKKEITHAFLSTTHEKYYQSFGELFGKNIPLLFTDEPKLADQAWSENLAERFMNEFGYDILDYLPELENPVTEAGRRAKIDYKRLLGILFDENFLTPCADWCHGHGIGLCGHLDRDNELGGSPAGQYGSGLKLLRRFDLPGIDVIWQQIFPGQPVDGFSFFPRLASSAARQSGSELSLSESFAVYGDSITSDQMRYVINYQFWQGINVFNFMTLPYGREKALAVNMRPMPCPEKPGFFSMEHIYKDTALLSAVMSTGRRVCDTALYLPAADISLGGEYKKRTEESFIRLGEELGNELIDFDIIDDEAILNAEKRSDGLCIGRALYRHIVIPECDYMPVEVRKIAENYPGRGNTLAVCDNPAIKVSARESKGETVYFVFNSGSRAEEFRLEIEDFPNVELEPGSRRLIPAKRQMKLESGEAAVLIKSDSLKPVEALESHICDYELCKIESIKRFRLTEHRVTTEMCEKMPEDLDGFSGEVSYRLSLPEGEILRLRFDLPGFRIAAYNGWKKLGDCGCTPQYIELVSPPREITLKISNDAACEIHAKLPQLMSVWDRAEYVSYNEKLMANEHPVCFKTGFKPVVKVSRVDILSK